MRVCGEIRRGKQERRDSEEGQGNPHRLLDSLIHANSFFSFVGVKDKSERGERSTGGGGGGGGNLQDRREGRGREGGKGGKGGGRRRRKGPTS